MIGVWTRIKVSLEVQDKAIIIINHVRFTRAQTILSHSHQEVHLVKQLEVVSEEETLEGLALEVAVSGLRAVVLEVIDNTK